MQRGRRPVSKIATTPQVPQRGMLMMNATKPSQKAQLGVPVLLLSLVFLTAYPVKSQSPAAPIVATLDQAIQQRTDQPSIRIKVKLVDAPVVVTDSNGELVL